MTKAPVLVMFAMTAGAVVVTMGGGCQSMNTPLYFNGTMTLETTGQPVDNMQERIKDVVALRFRNPTDAERQKLDERRNAADPVKVPWISQDQVHVSLTYTVKNLSDEEGVFNVFVDGATEYIKYDEDVVSMAIAQDPDEMVFLPLMQARPRMLGPGQTFTGTFREDDFVEAQKDLDAIDQFMAPFAAVVLNRSEANPIGLDNVPGNTTVPAMIEIDVTFTADKHMTMSYLVRVRDDDDQLLHEDGDTRFNPTPAVFTPEVPAP